MSVEALLLGAAQDAGFPQAGCQCAACTAAWAGAVPAGAEVFGLMTEPDDDDPGTQPASAADLGMDSTMSRRWIRL